MAKIAELQVRNAVRPFRKGLLAKARRGQVKTRIVGSPGTYSVAVEQGVSLFVISPKFPLRSLAVNWNLEKTGQSSPTRTVKAFTSQKKAA